MLGVLKTIDLAKTVLSIPYLNLKNYVYFIQWKVNFLSMYCDSGIVLVWGEQ